MQPLEHDEIVTINIEKAELASARLNRLLETVKAQRSTLNSNYVKIGQLLSEIRQDKLWIDLGFKSFGAYLKTIEEKLDLSRNHLYLYMGTSEDLLELVGEKNLIEMGIVKAANLRKAVKQSGKAPSDELIQKAIDPATKGADFDNAIATEYNFDSKHEDSSWYSMGGFFATDEERDELDRAIKAAIFTDPVIAKDVSDQMKTKLVILKWARDFLSAHEHEVEQAFAKG